MEPLRLLEDRQVRSKVDMERNAIKDQSRDGLHSGLLRFWQTIFAFAKVNDFDRVFVFVGCFRNLLFGLDTYRASGVKEYNFVHIMIFC